MNINTQGNRRPTMYDRNYSGDTGPLFVVNSTAAVPVLRVNTNMPSAQVQMPPNEKLP